MSSTSFGLSFLIGGSFSKSYFSTFDTAQQKVQKLGAAYDANDKRLKAANGVIKYKEKLTQLHKKQKLAGGSSKRLERGIKAVEQKYKQAKRAAKGYGLSIGDVVREQRKLGFESQKLETRLKRLNKASSAKGKLGDLRYKAMGVIGAAYAGSRLIGGAFAREDKVQQLGDVITGKNRIARLQASLNHAKAFSSKSLSSENEILEIDYSLRSAGLTDEAAMFASEVVAKVATVTKGSVGEVGFIIGDTFKNVGKTLEGTAEEKIAHIGDVLTKTKNLFSIKDFEQLGQGFKEAISGAQASQLPFEQTAALIGQINNGMLKGSQAGTGLNAILRQLPKAADKMGFEIVRSDTGDLDIIATLESLKTLLGEIGDIDESSMFIQKHFGDEGKKGLMPLLENLDDLKKNFEEVQTKSKGTFDEGYQRRVNSASGQWKMFSQNTSMAGTALANTLLPSINALLTPFGKLMGWVAKGIDEYPIIGYVVGGLATGFIAFGAGIGIVTAATWAWNVALAANPIGLIVGGVIALGAAIYSIYDNWDGITEWFGGLWSDFKEGLNGVGDWIADAFFNYHPLGMIIEQWEPITDYFKSMWGDIESVFFSGVASVLESFQSVSNVLPDWALPESLEGDKIGDTIKKYQQLSKNAIYTKAVQPLPNVQLSDLNLANGQKNKTPQKPPIKQTINMKVDIHNPSSQFDIEQALNNTLSGFGYNATSLLDEEF